MPAADRDNVMPIIRRLLIIADAFILTPDYRFSRHTLLISILIADGSGFAVAAPTRCPCRAGRGAICYVEAAKCAYASVALCASAKMIFFDAAFRYYAA